MSWVPSNQEIWFHFWSAFNHTPSGCCHWPCCDSHRFRTRTEACSCNRGTNDLARDDRRIDKWQAWACECKPFGPCWPFDKLQSQLNVLLCLPSHLSWGGSRRNSGLSKTPGANIGERQATDKWHRAYRSLIELCAFAAQVVTLSFQECQTSQISWTSLISSDFPDLTIFVDTHSSRVAESGCYEKMMRNGAAGIDKHRKEAWQARPECDPRDDLIWSDDPVRSIDNWLTMDFFIWKFSVHFAQGTACKGDPTRVRVCGTLGFIPSRFTSFEAVHT